MSNYISRTRSCLTLAVVLIVPAMGFAQEKPDLFILSVGVSKYVDKRFENGVVYAAKDAQNVAQSFLSQRGKRFNRVEAKILTDSQATVQNIREGMDWLADKSSANAHVIVFLAGHGGPNMVGTYEYTAHDTHSLVSSTRVQGSYLRDRMQKIAGKRFLILDTCHSGGFDFKDAEFAALASCSAKQQSSEKATLQNGLFTRCLVEAMSGKADLNADGTITVGEIESYVRSHLPGMTQGKQTLTAYRPASMAHDLPLLRVGSPSSPFASVAMPTTVTKTGPRVIGQ